MAGLQFASFFTEVAANSPPPKVPFSAVAPWQHVSSVRKRLARSTTLDTIVEEENLNFKNITSHLTAVSTTTSTSGAFANATSLFLFASPFMMLLVILAWVSMN